MPAKEKPFRVTYQPFGDAREMRFTEVYWAESAYSAWHTAEADLPGRVKRDPKDSQSGGYPKIISVEEIFLTKR